MADTQTATGASGKTYTFEIFKLPVTFKKLPGIYIFSKPGRNGNQDPIYIGITEDLSERFDNHHKMGCIKLHAATHISVLVKRDKSERERIEKDLIKSLNPHCNDTYTN